QAAPAPAAPARKVPPGQAKKSSGWQPPGQAKKSSGGQPPGQAKKGVTQLSQSGGGKKSARAKRRAHARARAAAAARRRAVSRRRAAAASRLARRRAAAAARPARLAVTTGAVAAAPTAGSQPAAAPAPQANKKKKAGRRPFVAVPPRDQLPQPLRVVRDVVHVVPTPLRFLIAGLVALAILLAGAAGMTLLRSRRLERQRSELLGQVGLLQAALLPDLPEDMGVLSASVAYRPAEGTAAGGDFYDVVPLAGGQMAVIIGDVSGHGRDALARTALARYTLRAYVEAGMEPHEALQVGGSVLLGKLDGDFVTAMIAVHDAAAATLTYAAAGHPPPIVISSTPFKPILTGAAPPLGIGASTGQRQTTVPFPRGTIACFYTDGLSEARMPSGRLVGAAGLERIVGSLGPDVTAQQVIDGVAAASRRIGDDAAACVIAAQGGSAIVRSRTERLELTRSELRGPMLRRFLDACGVSPQRVRAAERQARELAGGEAGGAVLEVRIGERPDVDVRAPDMPLREDAVLSGADRGSD
ncbi:MAG TPA: PP2C family protein-serine/threonine phosphatase, partial [Gaiellaceae bacterium]